MNWNRENLLTYIASGKVAFPSLTAPSACASGGNTQRAVMAYLVTRSDDKGMAPARIADIGASTGISRTAVIRCIGALRRHGYIGSPYHARGEETHIFPILLGREPATDNTAAA